MTLENEVGSPGKNYPVYVRIKHFYKFLMLYELTDKTLDEVNYKWP